MSVYLSNPPQPQFTISGSEPDSQGACGIPAWGAVRASLEEIAELRRAPAREGQAACPGNFLRHADEQTVVALAAVYRAMHDFGLSGEHIAEWGVVSASRYIGRLASAQHLEKVKARGPSATSPHVIPQHSLHSISSAISVALGSKGPNFGAGGGPGFIEQGLMMAALLLDDPAVPALWLTLTQWDPEPVPNLTGQCTNEAWCYGVAFAVSAVAASGLTLHFRRAADRPTDWRGLRGVPSGHRRHTPATIISSVPDLAGYLQRQAFAIPGTACIRSPSGGLVFQLGPAQTRVSRIAA